MTTRNLYTPGADKMGKEIVGFNQSVQDDFDAIQSRKRELSVRLAVVNTEIGGILASLGVLMADRGDWRGAAAKLAELRAEHEALEAGIQYLDGQEGLLRRLNPWL